MVFNWSGFYIGGNVGWGYTSAEFDTLGGQRPHRGPWHYQLRELRANRVVRTGGVQAGWQRQWNTWVFGIEAGYTAVRFDNNQLAPEVGGTSADLSRSVQLRDIFTVTGRLGYAYEQWLAYAKGGWATADVSGTYTQASTGTVLSTASGRQNGWTAGVGVDYAIHPNLFLGIEYNYLSIRTELSLRMSMEWPLAFKLVQLTQIPRTSCCGSTTVSGIDHS